jgi:hypothetical protein
MHPISWAWIYSFVGRALCSFGKSLQVWIEVAAGMKCSILGHGFSAPEVIRFCFNKNSSKTENKIKTYFLYNKYEHVFYWHAKNLLKKIHVLVCTKKTNLIVVITNPNTPNNTKFSYFCIDHQACHFSQKSSFRLEYILMFVVEKIRFLQSVGRGGRN